MLKVAHDLPALALISYYDYGHLNNENNERDPVLVSRLVAGVDPGGSGPRTPQGPADDVEQSLAE